MSLLHRIWNLVSPFNDKGEIILEPDSNFRQVCAHNNQYGSFFCLSPVANVAVLLTTCRESFSYCVNGEGADYTVSGKKCHTFGYISSDLNFAKVVSFFNQIEAMLGERAHVDFYTTQRKNILLFKPSTFWTESIMRHNVLSMLIRCAGSYQKETLDESFKNYNYTTTVRKALDWFLAGNVHEVVKGDVALNKGFVRIYTGQETDEQLAKKLRKEA